MELEALPTTSIARFPSQGENFTPTAAAKRQHWPGRPLVAVTWQGIERKEPS
jgi:hypothetical protein